MNILRMLLAAWLLVLSFFTNAQQGITVNLGPEGTYRDRETGLLYNGARYVDKHGRFITADPISVAAHVQRWQANLGALGQPPLELNPFVRVANNPLRWTDPTGLDVTITYFPGGPGHIGVGVNSPNTSGLYPRQRSIGVAFCRDVPGAVSPDQERQGATSISRSRSVTIRTTPEQDVAVQAFIEIASNNPRQEYNLCSNQCTGFVRGALQAGGIPVLGDSNSIVPITFFEQIEQAHGGRQQ